MIPNLFDPQKRAQIEWAKLIEPARDRTVAETLQNYIKNMRSKAEIPIYAGVFIDLYIKGWEQYMNESALKLPYGEISEIAILSTICSNTKDHLHKLYSRIIKEPNKFIGGTTVKKLAMLMKAFPNEDAIYELFDYWKTPLKSKNAKKVEYTDDDMDDIELIKEELKDFRYIKQLDQLTQKISLTEAQQASLAKEAKNIEDTKKALLEQAREDVIVDTKNNFKLFLEDKNKPIVNAIDNYIANTEIKYSKSPHIVKACIEMFFELCMDNFKIIVYKIETIRELIKLFAYYKKLPEDTDKICKAKVAKEIYERSSNHFDNCISTIKDFVELISLYAAYPDYQEKLYQRNREKLKCDKFTNNREYLDLLIGLLPHHEKDILESADIELCNNLQPY